MLVMASPLLAFALAATQGARNEDWIPASGTDNCSVTDVDFADGPSGFAAGAFNCGLLSDDGGYTWTAVDVIPQQGQSLVWAHAASPDELFAARLGFYRSTDRGQTWSEVGTLSSQIGSLFDVHFVDAQHLVAIKGGQLLNSTDGGENWDITYPGEFNINFDELHFPAADIGYATGGVARESGSAGTVLRTDDAGASWTLLDFQHGKITAADFFDADHAIVATQSEGFFATADGAQTWQFLAVVPGTGLVIDLAHRDALRWYAATTAGCIYESVDGGQSWQEAYCDPQERSLAALTVRGGAAVAAGNDGLVVYENRIFRDGFESSPAD